MPGYIDDERTLADCFSEDARKKANDAAVVQRTAGRDRTEATAPVTIMASDQAGMGRSSVAKEVYLKTIELSCCKIFDALAGLRKLDPHLADEIEKKLFVKPMARGRVE